MAATWIELGNGDIVNLDNITSIHRSDEGLALLDASGYYTDISESDKKRIVALLKQNSCLELTD